MTCFWDGILHSLTLSELSQLSPIPLLSKPKPHELVRMLQANNRRPSHVRWMNEPLSNQLQQELWETVRDFTVSSITQGYLCSTCDAFLCLLCELIQIPIRHNYLQRTMIMYDYSMDSYRSSNSHTSRCLQFASNQGHFWNQ